MKYANKLLDAAVALQVSTPEDARAQHRIIQEARSWASRRGQTALVQKADTVQAETAIRRLAIFKEDRERRASALDPRD